MALTKVQSGMVNQLASSNMPAGSVLQVVNAITTNTVSTTNASLTSTGFSVSITPTSATSKIFVIVSGDGGCGTAANSSWYTIYRNSTNLATGTATSIMADMRANGSSDMFAPVIMTVLDSPNTTSSTTYTVYYGNTSAGSLAYWNAAPGLPSSAQASITAMEIAA